MAAWSKSGVFICCFTSSEQAGLENYNESCFEFQLGSDDWSRSFIEPLFASLVWMWLDGNALPLVPLWYSFLAVPGMTHIMEDNKSTLLLQKNVKPHIEFFWPCLFASQKHETFIVTDNKKLQTAYSAIKILMFQSHQRCHMGGLWINEHLGSLIWSTLKRTPS